MTFRKVSAPLALVAALATLTGCPAVSPQQVQQAVQAAAQYAQLGLKMLDDAGIETGIDKSLIQKLMVGGKEIAAEFDAEGNLKIPVDAQGKDQIVEVVLKDGQTVTVPLKAKANEKHNAFLMPGAEDGKLHAEVAMHGQKLMDVIKDKTSLFEIGNPKLTNENAHMFFVGSLKAPRHSWYVENGDLRLHASNLWLLMHARGGQPAHAQGGQPPQGGMPPQGGGMQPPPQGGQPPAPAGLMPTFQLAQTQPPPPPPGGTTTGTQPPPGGTQPPPGGTQPPPGGTQPPPGGTQPPPGGTQPPPGGTQPPPGGMQPPPGGMQPMPAGGQPPMGGMQPKFAPKGDAGKIVFRLVVSMDGKFKAWSFTPKDDKVLPGPPPMPGPGQAPMFKDLPTFKKEWFEVKEIDLANLDEFEKNVVEKQQGKFLPPPPPGGRPPMPGGMQPPPGGMQPPPGGQPPQGGTQPPPAR